MDIRPGCAGGRSAVQLIACRGRLLHDHVILIPEKVFVHSEPPVCIRGIGADLLFLCQVCISDGIVLVRPVYGKLGARHFHGQIVRGGLFHRQFPVGHQPDVLGVVIDVRSRSPQIKTLGHCRTPLPGKVVVCFFLRVIVPDRFRIPGFPAGLSKRRHPVNSLYLRREGDVKGVGGRLAAFQLPRIQDAVWISRLLADVFPQHGRIQLIEYIVCLLGPFLILSGSILFRVVRLSIGPPVGRQPDFHFGKHLPNQGIACEIGNGFARFPYAVPVFIDPDMAAYGHRRRHHRIGNLVGTQYLPGGRRRLARIGKTVFAVGAGEGVYGIGPGIGIELCRIPCCSAVDFSGIFHHKGIVLPQFHILPYRQGEGADGFCVRRFGIRPSIRKDCTLFADSQHIFIEIGICVRTGQGFRIINEKVVFNFCFGSFLVPDVNFFDSAKIQSPCAVPGRAVGRIVPLGRKDIDEGKPRHSA